MPQFATDVIDSHAAGGRAPSLARSEPCIVRHHDHDRYVVTNRRVHLHAVPAEGAVSTENNHWLVRTRDLGANAKRDADAHAAMRAGIQTSADFVDGNRLPGEVENLMAI